MKYKHMIRGVFLSRPNRFIALVLIHGQEEKCHVKNTGRLRELLIPGAAVWVQSSDNPARKTKYSLIAVEKEEVTEEDGKTGRTLFVNLDSQAPNEAAAEWLARGGDGRFGDLTMVKREKKFGSSRFDFYMEAGERKMFMEVKGVTLADGETARFPDAPTERGVKHVEELMACKEAGYEAYLLFVIQMKGICRFEPNENTHPEFGRALRAASGMGVHILAYDCLVTEDSLTIDQPVAVTV